MTATPIPRTLHLSLLGLRDISNLETPPDDRLAIETRVTRFEPRPGAPRDHARAEPRRADLLRSQSRPRHRKSRPSAAPRSCPRPAFAIGHGQMPEGELERVMLDFVDHQFDMLLATTIVESGLDIPNANTIFIDEADRYGLADLHQLRGRVGPLQAPGLLLPAHRSAQASVDHRRPAAAGDRGVQPDGAGLRHRHARSGNSRRRQHPGHAAERPHRHGRLRAVLRAAGAGRAQAQAVAAEGDRSTSASTCPAKPTLPAATCPTCG